MAQSTGQCFSKGVPRLRLKLNAQKLGPRPSTWLLHRSALTQHRTAPCIEVEQTAVATSLQLKSCLSVSFMYSAEVSRPHPDTKKNKQAESSRRLPESDIKIQLEAAWTTSKLHATPGSAPDPSLDALAASPLKSIAKLTRADTKASCQGV